MLQGMNIRLRALEREDSETLHAWWNDPELWSQMGSRRRVSSRDELDAWLDTELDKTSSQEGKTLGIEDLDGELLGTIWFGAYDAGDRQTTVGLYLGDSETRGRGLGQDALDTLLSYLFDDLGLHKARLYVVTTNERAIACYERCGFQVEGTLRDHRFFAGRFHDFLAMAVLAPDWRASRA